MIKKGVLTGLVIMSSHLFGMIKDSVQGPYADSRLNSFHSYLVQEKELFKENEGLEAAFASHDKLVVQRTLLHALYFDQTVASSDVDEVDDAYSQFLEVLKAEQRGREIDQRERDARQHKRIIAVRRIQSM